MDGRGSSSLGSLGLSGVRLKQVKLRGIRRWVSLVERRKNNIEAIGLTTKEGLCWSTKYESRSTGSCLITFVKMLAVGMMRLFVVASYFLCSVPFFSMPLYTWSSGSCFTTAFIRLAVFLQWLNIQNCTNLVACVKILIIIELAKPEERERERDRDYLRTYAPDRPWSTLRTRGQAAPVSQRLSYDSPFPCNDWTFRIARVVLLLVSKYWL